MIDVELDARVTAAEETIQGIMTLVSDRYRGKNVLNVSKIICKCSQKG